MIKLSYYLMRILKGGATVWNVWHVQLKWVTSVEWISWFWIPALQFTVYLVNLYIVGHHSMHLVGLLMGVKWVESKVQCVLAINIILKVLQIAWKGKFPCIKMRTSQEQVLHAHIHTAHSPYSCLIHIRRLTAESHLYYSRQKKLKNAYCGKI